MNTAKIMTIVLAFLLVASNIFWWIGYTAKQSQVIKAQEELATTTQNKKVLVFHKMFVEKVLMANGVVDFNTRVELQNAVTNIQDEEILQVWNAFLAAKTEAEGQGIVKELLVLLASKAYTE